MLVSHTAAKKRDINSQFREMLMIDALSRVQKMDKNDFIEKVGLLKIYIPTHGCRYLCTQIIYIYI